MVKDFRGNDSTKAAIEASKKLKGTTRYLLLTERSIKILKSDGKVTIRGVMIPLFGVAESGITKRLKIS